MSPRHHPTLLNMLPEKKNTPLSIDTIEFQIEFNTLQIGAQSN